MRFKSYILAAGFAALAAPLLADGVFLKLSSPKARLAPQEPADLTVQAVATRSVSLPPPEVWVDDGSGFQARPELKCEGAEVVAVTPDRAVRSTCRLSVGQPGTYRIRLRYRLKDRIHETNKVTLEVASQQAAQPSR